MKFELNETRELLGKVSEQEREEIRLLFERKNGLIELSKILDASNDSLYQKLIKDLGETSTKFQAWWDTKSKEYNWENLEGHSWEIDFNTCDIFLKKNS